jgi:two-component system chemotaxis response regulator CheY
MKTLIVEDDPTSQLLLQELLMSYGVCHTAVNGKEAVETMRLALEAEEPYDLICLDIMMLEMDGHAAPKHIRALEEDAGIWPAYRVKIVMITALLGDQQNTSVAYSNLCHACLTEPITRPSCSIPRAKWHSSSESMNQGDCSYAYPNC